MSAEQFERLFTLFDNLEIPYKTELLEVKCFIDKPQWFAAIDDRPEINDMAPANSRVIIETGTEQFNVSNFNTYLIKESTSEKIKAYADSIYAPAFKEDYKVEAKTEEKPKYEQVSLFQTA